jgi:ribosomal protein S15P/S13E
MALLKEQKSQVIQDFRRRRLLGYLRREDISRYRELIQRLGLRR